MTARQLQELSKKVVAEAEEAAAAAVKSRRGAPQLLPHLATMRIEAVAASKKADRLGHGKFHHRLLLLLSEIDQLEGDVGGPK